MPGAEEWLPRPGFAPAAQNPAYSPTSHSLRFAPSAVTAAQQTGRGHGLRAPVVRFLETAFISVSNPFIFKENTAQT